MVVLIFVPENVMNVFFAQLASLVQPENILV